MDDTEEIFHLMNGKEVTSLKCWKEYVETLFNELRPEQPPRLDDNNEGSPEITREEIKHSIQLQNGKAAVQIPDMQSYSN